MLKFISTRLVESIGVLLCVSLITFFLSKAIPGGPFDDEKKVPEAVKKQLEAYYGLDQPGWKQYLTYTFQFPNLPSTKFPNRKVGSMIATKFKVSVELGIYSLAVALLLGIPSGILASLRPNSLLDYIPSSVSMVGICLPTFVMGPALVLIFAVNLQWFNATGWEYASDKILPSLTLGLYYAAYVARLTRGGMLEVLSQDFIRTAMSKGASKIQVILKHALRGGLLPVISFLGPAAAGLIAGSFVVETVFGIPGMGQEFVNAVSNRDITFITGLVLFFAALIIVFNLLVDIALVFLNPKLSFKD